MLDLFLRDIRYGIRMLERNPGVTAVAVLALALGIGANTAIFSAVYAVLLRPLPVREAERLTEIVSANPRFTIPQAETGYAVYSSWARQNQSFESMAAVSKGSAALSSGPGGEQVPLWRVTANFFSTMGVKAAAGRLFSAEDATVGAPRVAVLSHSLWQRRFAASLAAVGGSINLDGEQHTVVGVLPPGFHIDGRPADVYAPIARSEADESWLGCSVYGRLRPGITIQRGQADMDTVTSRLVPAKMGWGSRVWGIREAQVRDIRLSLLVLLGAVGLVLLIACANIASLLLARASARQREMAIRTALGAGRKTLIRQLLTESVMLALLGGLLGVLLAAWCVGLIPLIQNERIPTLLGQTRIDGAVLAFTAIVSLLTGMVFGVAPALSASQTKVQESLAEGGRAGVGLRRKRLWSYLVVTETALALMLMVGATLLIRSFFYLRDVAPGFRVDGLFAASISPSKEKYKTREQFLDLYQRLLENLRGIPGVQSATLARALPLGGEYMSMSVAIEGHQFTRVEDVPILWYRSVDPDYFRTLQIPLRRGRLFTDRDGPGTPRVAIINETMARRFWPGQDAVGKHLGQGDEQWEIVGVTGDVRHMDATRDAPVEVIFCSRQDPPTVAVLAVRADPRVYRDPLLMAPAISRAVASVDRDLELSRTGTVLQTVSDRIAPKRVSAALIAVFAGLALLLAAVGIYGVLSFSVAQQTHEIGVRIALGARQSAVLGMVVGRAASLALTGIAIGVAGSFVLTRVIASLIFGVSPTDPLVFLGVSATLLIAAMLAAYLPARRAATVDPLVALRHV